MGYASVRERGTHPGPGELVEIAGSTASPSLSTFRISIETLDRHGCVEFQQG